MLDSSPVALPRPLKRSASTASLPTPPRTHHKRKHVVGRGRSSYDTDTDLESTASEDDEAAGRHRHKKRKTDTGAAPDAEEEAFWMSKSDGDAPGPTSTSHKHPSPAPALLYRRRLAATSSVGAAPVSPPPSNRRTTAVVSPPVTPQPKRIFPMRDSPNNPFLASPSSATIAENSASPSPNSSPNPSPHTPVQERPTVTYVFRGVRGTFPNPLYDHERGRPISPSAESKLPVEHPDFSPDPHCPPKLLFPPAAPRKGRQRQSARVARREGAGSGKGAQRQRTLEEEMRAGGHERSGSVRKRARAVSGSDSEGKESSEGDERIMPMKLDFKTQAEVKGSSSNLKR